MQISRRQWHTKVYLWWYEHKYGRPKQGAVTNLCSYVRAVLFWTPLRVVFWNWVKLYKVRKHGYPDISLNMLTIPALMYLVPVFLGYWNYTVKYILWIVYLAALFLILFSLAIGLIIWGIECLFNKNYGVAATIGATKFGTLCMEYLRVGHDRVCPEVTITD